MYANIDRIKDLLDNPSFMDWVKKPNALLDKYWQDWLIQNPERREDFKLARKFVLAIHYKHEYELSNDEKNEMLNKIKAVKQKKDKVNQHPIIELFKKYAFAGFTMAASVTMLILGNVYLTDTQKPEPFSISRKDNLVEVTTSYTGQRTKIILPDGSIVHLNAGSSLSYPNQFSKEQRVVTLVGEGFFEVVKNPKQPFFVETGKVQTRVLGTSFNVRAYSSEKIVQVAVVTGKVKMQEKATGKAQFLTPNEMGVLDQNAEIHKTQVDVQKNVGWKQGVLVFDKDEFSDVFTKLEIWYGVKIIKMPTVNLKGRYSGDFQQESLENVMQGIAFTSGFKYEIVGKTIFIH
jgi:transmembrane sensor